MTLSGNKLQLDPCRPLLRRWLFVSRQFPLQIGILATLLKQRTEDRVNARFIFTKKSRRDASQHRNSFSNWLLLTWNIPIWPDSRGNWTIALPQRSANGKAAFVEIIFTIRPNGCGVRADQSLWEFDPPATNRKLTNVGETFDSGLSTLFRVPHPIMTRSILDSDSPSLKVSYSLPGPFMFVFISYR